MSSFNVSLVISSPTLVVSSPQTSAIICGNMNYCLSVSGGFHREKSTEEEHSEGAGHVIEKDVQDIFSLQLALQSAFMS